MLFRSLSFRMRAGTEGADSGVLASRFDMAESPAVVTQFGGGRRVGSIDDVVVAKGMNSEEVV